MNKVSGVYKITNTVTGDFYIGSSKNIKQRWSGHRKPYNLYKYPNSRMYKDIYKQGIDSFLIEIIEETDNLIDREQYWIEKLKPNYNNYNAKGLNVERQKKSNIKANKKYREVHPDRRKATCRKCYEKYKEKIKAYNGQLCLYNKEYLTLQALRKRLRRLGIEHPTQEAKKYLINKKGENK